MPLALDTPQTYPTYTNLGLGEGIFDRLMTAVRHHIEEEYKSGRIDKATYGALLTQGIETALSNSTQYLLGLLLLDEKRRNLDLDNQTKEYNLEVILPLQADKLQKEIDKILAEISLMGKQEEKIDKEMIYLDAKTMTERANTETGIAAPDSLVGKQITLLTAQRLGFAGDIQTKIGKLYADYDAVFQSVQEIETATTLSSTTQTKLVAANNIAAAIQALI